MGTVANLADFAASDAAPAASRSEPRSVVVVTAGGEAPGGLPDGLAAEGMAMQSVASVGGLMSPPARWDAIVFTVPRGLTEHLTELRLLRQRWRSVPLIVVCNTQRELDHVLAFEVGADEVVDATWPASVVAARLRALWRQADRWRAHAAEPEVLSFGALVLRCRERQVELGGHVVALTDGEFDVLWLLVNRAGSTVTRVDMLRSIRGTSSPHVDRSIDSRIHRIRLKLGDTGRTQPRIRCVRNCGYLFSPVGW